MYRGNTPGQYNGSRMPTGQEYTGAYGMSHPGQSPMRGQAMPGHGVQRFQNTGYGVSSSQMQYRAPQAGTYPTDPYSYNQGKMTGEVPQSFPGLAQTTLSGSRMYGSTMQSRPPGVYPRGSVPELPVVSDSNIAMQQYRHNKPLTPGWNSKPSSEMSMMHYGQTDQTAGGMYNGSQYMGNMGTMQASSGQNDPNVHPRHSIPTQNPSNYTGSDGAQPPSGSMQSYPQQMSSVPAQYQQRPTMSIGMSTASSSMYMQQQYSGQAQQLGGSYPQISTPMQSVSKVPGQFDDTQMLVQQQQTAMKQGQVYRAKTPGSAGSTGSLPQSGMQQQQMMGAPSQHQHPLQQAMSPRHNSPLSPMRGNMTSRPNMPPASPQLQTARTTPQYPTPQASPHMHQAGPMSPTSRLPAYSPKQMGPNYMNQGQVPPGYRPNLTPSRTPTPRNEQASRGFMSPPHLMSPPPASQSHTAAHSQGVRMHTPSYNGDASMQHYYSSTARYPHAAAWQGPRTQVPPPGGQNVSAASLQPRQPLPQQMQRPTRYPVQQPLQQQQAMYNSTQFGQAPNAASSSQMSFQQMLNPPTSMPSQQSNSMLSANPPTAPSVPGQNDFDNEFNLDSLLGDAMDGTGSLLQQLEDVPSVIEAAKSTSRQTTQAVTEPAVQDKNLLGSLMLNTPSQSTVQHNTSASSVNSANSGDGVDSSNSSVSNVLLPTVNSSQQDDVNESGEIDLETSEISSIKATPLPESSNFNISSSSDTSVNETTDKTITTSAATAMTSSPPLSVQTCSGVSTMSSSVSNENVSLLSPVRSVGMETPTLVDVEKDAPSQPTGTSVNSSTSEATSCFPPQLPSQSMPGSMAGSTSQSAAVPANHQVPAPGSLMMSSAGNFPGMPVGGPVTVTGSVPGSHPGTVPGSHPGPVPGSHPGSVPGSHPGPIPGSHSVPVPGSHPGSVPGSHPGPIPGSHSVPVPGSHPGPIPGSHPVPVPGSHPGSVPGSHPGSVPGSHPGLVPGSHPGSVPGSRPGLVPGVHPSNIPGGHPGQMRPRMPGDPTQYGPMHQNMMGVPPRVPQPGGPQGPGGMVRGPGPGYPPMHPRYHQRPHPYGYGPHPQNAPGPYPAASAPQHGRPPYTQPGPHMPGGPPPHGYMGQRPYPQPLHPSQQQHLQQRLQGLRHEAQQLQAQLQRVQQEEAEADPSVPPEHSPRCEQLRGRLMEVDRNIRQIMAQLHGPPHHGPQPMQDQGPPMTSLSGPPGFPHDGGSPTRSIEDGMTSGKKKRQRKSKTPKTPKGEGEEGRKPPKKKKKKEFDGEMTPSGDKKKKKKSKKITDKSAAAMTDGDVDIIDTGEGESSNQSKSNATVGDDVFNDIIPDDDSADYEAGEIPARMIEKAKKVGEKRKKKPPATVVKPKKKRKKGYDSSDEMNATDIIHSTPPPSPDDSLIEKRRSGRNVKRKRYVESVDLPFSGGEDDSDAPVLEKKKQQIVEMNDMADDEEVMVVDKILSHRIRKRRVQRKSETKDKPETAEGAAKNADTSGNSSNLAIDVTSTDESKPLEHNLAPNGAMLSPTSLKNPRIRRFSMGVDHLDEEEEIVGEGEDEYFVKYKKYSYLHCEWKTKDEIEDKRFDQKLKRYLAKNIDVKGQLFYPEVEDDELFNPDFVEVDRVLDVTHNEQNENGQPTRHFLIKWCSLAYEDSTWEQEEDIEKVKIEEFEERCRYRPPRRTSRPHKDSWKRMGSNNLQFCNNNVLRDYQFEGVNWLLFNWYNKRNCILADEMGLGKTIQSITFLQKIFDHGIHGPFLIVAPLSTIANWQREFASWTTINAVVYHGSQTSRDMIQTYEWFCRDENLDEIEGCYKTHAVITTYEMVVLDSPHLRDVDWRCLIIDEAHRLKNLSCKLVESLRNMQLEHKVLLTGTPLQNNVEELFALLSFLQPETFNCQQAFSIEFGNLKDNAQVEKLQELLKPMMLRRLKEDVEKSLAPKQETIIEVELTNIQKKYYRAILERNFEFLAKGTAGGNVPNLMNTMMELRKCCNHPYLIKGAEDKITQEHRDLNNEFNPLQAMIQSSGKLVLIDKLLPRLKEGGHKVLVFSQMVRVLDILEDYLVQRGHLYERIDGCIRGNERQMAIDRFSRKGSDRFVFLLCTRAGGLGINLTAADTVIIFDSDWNPQNDLQAQARCHRIGQQKPVKVYRLITRNSYEREMFDKASLKLGLDKAVLQSISGRQDQITNQTSQPQLSKHEVEDLLKRGAYGAIMDDDDAGSKFCEEDIDQILDRRAHTVTLESGEKGSTFSKASFVSAEDRSDISLDDPNFWEKWAKKADLDLERLTDNKLILEIPRNRKQTRRFGGNSDDTELFAEIGSDSDDSAEYDSDGTEGQSRKSKFRSRAGGPGGGQRRGWGRRDCFRIEKCLLTFGWGRWLTVQQRGRFNGVISIAELEEMSRSVLMYCLKYYNGDEKIKFFMWDLITPAEFAQMNSIDLRNHEGLAAPVPRGRKGKRAKEDLDKIPDEQSRREWARETDLDTMLPDDGFKKHIQHQCNKVLLRVRMLYYLRTEILNNLTSAIDNGAKYDAVDLDIVDRISDPPASWWDRSCDKCLLIGTYKHGYEKYNLIRGDSMLCFLEKVGPPDERALAAEMDVEPDGDVDGDPEYKPARITFTEMEFGQESPAPSTPTTEPASPASVDSSAKKKDEEEKDDVPIEAKKKESVGKDWPTVSELNTRLRRIITAYQKHHKHIQQRLMNMDRRSGRTSRFQDTSRVEVRRTVHQARWTRREEADFYRTVSTFGIERDPRTGEFTWRRFRNIARLDRKTDESLRSYYLAFRNMCEQVCRWKGDPGTSDGTNIGVTEEIPNIDVDPITEERASRTLYRIRLLDKIRCDVLNHPKLKERLAICQRSSELPIWWRNGVHDHELLIAMDRHGVTRTEIHTLNDPNLTFLKSMREYEANPSAIKQQVLSHEKAELENLMKIMKSEQEAKEAIIKAELEAKKESLKEEVEKGREEAAEEKVKEENDEEKMDVEEMKPTSEETIAKSEETDVKAEDVKAEDNPSSPEVKAEDESKVEEASQEERDTMQPSDEMKQEESKLEEEPKQEEVKMERKEVEADEEEMEVDIKEEREDKEAVKSEEDIKEEPMKETDATVSDKPETHENADDKPDNADDKPDNADDKPDNADDKPDIADDKPDIADDKPDTADKNETVNISESAITENDETAVKKTDELLDEAGALQMSLRSKNHPTMTQDLYSMMTSGYSGFNQMSSPYIINSMNGRWPKDRILIQRVEHICYCIINGEWPNTNQSLLPSMSTPSDSQAGAFSASGRSQASTPLSEGRGTPIPTTISNVLSNPQDITMLATSEKQLQAAMAQLLASSDTSSRSQSYSSRRGRRKKRNEPQIIPSSGPGGLSFGNQALASLPMDKSLQRKIEQLMAGNNPNLQASNSAGNLFSSQGGNFNSQQSSSRKSNSSKSTSNLDDEAGNSSASLLANLRELAKAETKSEQSSSRSRERSSSGFRRHHSPSQSRSKESSKSSTDLLKSQQQFMASPEQLMAMNAPLQQVMQDAIKAGVDPMTAVATFLPLFPMLDPFQMMNASKPENLPQLHPQLPLPLPGDMEKILKSMGLPPELAMMSGMFPGGILPSTSSKPDRKEPESQPETSSKANDTTSSLPGIQTDEKRISSIVGDKRSTPQRRGVSKLDAMFGGGKLGDESPGKSSSKKSRKSKFVSPAMLPPDTRIPVHNNNEGVRISGKDAPLNQDLADWLKDNQGFVVDYQALRQQLDDSGSKKLDTSNENVENDSDQMVSPKARASPMLKEAKHKDILDEAATLLKNAEKLVEHHRSEPDEGGNERQRTPDKTKQSDFALPNPVPVSSPASSRAGSSAIPTHSSSLKQQQQELSMLQQMNAAAGLADPATAALFSLPPEILSNLANLPPDVATLIAGGFLPGAVNPDLLAASLKPARAADDKHADPASPSRSSTPSRASPSQRRQDKHLPSDPSQLTGDERVTVVNVTTGKKLSGRQAPELITLADYLRVYPDVVVSPDWSNVIRKSKFLPKDLHSRLLPARPSTPSKTSASSSHAMSPSVSSNAALAAALGGLPPGAAAMFPGLMGQGQAMMNDPMQLMAALQQMPGQGQMDMKALAASGFPMLPFFGGLPNPLLVSGFPGQDAATVAAMAALSQGQTPPPPPQKKDRSSSSHERSSSDSRGRKSKKHSDRSGSGNRSSSSSFKQNQPSFGADPMVEALAALQRSGGLPGMANPFLPGAGSNPMLFPPMMMGGNSMGFPMEMMNPELLAAQMAAFGLPNMDALKPTSSSSSSGGQKLEKRRGSSSSSSASHKPTSSGRSQSRGATDEQPIDLTQFAGGIAATKDRQTPDKHKH